MGNEVFDRLRQGPQEQRNQYDNWNEMVGAAPPDRAQTDTTGQYSDTTSQYTDTYRSSESARSSEEGEGFLGKILGNRALMMGAAALAGKVFSDQVRKRQGQRRSSSDTSRI